jgi:hypothetical protein
MHGAKMRFWPAAHFDFSQQAREVFVARSVFCFCLGEFCSLLPDGVLAAGRIEAHLQKGPETHEMNKMHMRVTHKKRQTHAEINVKIGQV